MTKKKSKKAPKGKKSKDPLSEIKTPENECIALSIANSIRNRVGTAFTQPQWEEKFAHGREQSVVQTEFNYAMTFLHVFKMVIIDKIDDGIAFYNIIISDENEKKLITTAIEELKVVIEQAQSKKKELEEELKKLK